MQDDIKTAVENLTAVVDALDDARSGSLLEAPDLIGQAVRTLHNVRRDLEQLAAIDTRKLPCYPHDEIDDSLSRNKSRLVDLIARIVHILQSDPSTDDRVKINRIRAALDLPARPPEPPSNEQVIGVGNGLEVRGTPAAIDRVEALLKRTEKSLDIGYGLTLYGSNEALKRTSDTFDRAADATGMKQTIDKIRTALSEEPGRSIFGRLQHCRQIVGLAPMPKLGVVPRSRVKATADSVAQPVHGVYVLSELEVEQIVDRCVIFLKQETEQ